MHTLRPRNKPFVESETLNVPILHEISEEAERMCADVVGKAMIVVTMYEPREASMYQLHIETNPDGDEYAVFDLSGLSTARIAIEASRSVILSTAKIGDEAVKSKKSFVETLHRSMWECLRDVTKLKTTVEGGQLVLTLTIGEHVIPFRMTASHFRRQKM